MCTPLPVSALRYAGSVATSVSPSPVFISAILPLCSTMPPSICTSKWRMCNVRLEASRTTAKASGSSASSAAPSACRFFNSLVLARSASSDSFSSAGSSALIACTACEYCLSSRWLRLPNMRAGRRQRASKNLRRDSTGGGENRRFYWKNLLLLAASDRSRGDQELGGILRRAAEAHFEMQVRAGGAAGGADLADLPAPLHQVALAHHDLRGVRVARHEVVAVIDVDHVAVLGMEAGENHYAAGGGDDRRAVFGDEVDAFVHRPLPVERVDAPAEARGVVRRAYRHHRWDHLLLHRLLEELRFEHAEHVIAALDLAREHQQLLAELAERQVLRRQHGRRGAAQAGRLGAAELLRANAGERRQALAEGVHAREVGLHLAQLHRHRIQVLLQEHALALGFGFLGGGNQLLQHRQAHLGGIAQRQPVERGGRAEQQHERQQPRADEVPQRHVD